MCSWCLARNINDLWWVAAQAYDCQLSFSKLLGDKQISRLVRLLSIKVHREFAQLRAYRVFDDADNGDIGVEIIYADDGSDEFLMSSLSYHKTIDLRYACDGGNRFARLTHMLEESVAEAGSRLATINSTIQKLVHEFNADCQRTGSDVSNTNVALCRVAAGSRRRMYDSVLRVSGKC